MTEPLSHLGIRCAGVLFHWELPFAALSLLTSCNDSAKREIRFHWAPPRARRPRGLRRRVGGDTGEWDPSGRCSPFLFGSPPRSAWKTSSANRNCPARSFPATTHPSLRWGHLLQDFTMPAVGCAALFAAEHDHSDT